MAIRDDIELLNSAEDPRVLKKALVRLANSGEQEAYAQLARRLNDTGFLLRLDDAEMYAGSHHRLRLATVLRVLWSNRQPLAQRLLAWLTTADNYLADTGRIALLIRATGELRPPAEAVVAYWRRFAGADCPLLYNTVQALCINQSGPAMALLRDLLQAPQVEPGSKADWVHELILPRRNDLPLLTCCEQVMQASSDAALRTLLFDALFDYRPDEWYVGCDKPRPPAFEAATPAGRDTFRRIANHASQQWRLTRTQQRLVRHLTEPDEV